MTIDSWTSNLVDMFRETFGEKASLLEVEIWIGASSENNEIIEILETLKNTFQGLGAIVKSTALNSSDLKLQYEGPVVQADICRADIILMIAATPGTSAKALDICHRYERDKHIDIEKMLVYLPGQFNQGTIHRLLCMYRVSPVTLPSSVSDRLIDDSRDFIRKCAAQTINKSISIRMKEELRKQEFNPNIAIITALPKELKSAIAILEEQRRDLRPDQDGIFEEEFHHGKVNSEHGGYHHVVIGRCGMGNNNASILATTLLLRYRTVKVILMVGIAGGIPDRKAEKHVRLGDIVVCDQNGVFQYDMVKLYSDHTERRPSPRPPSSRWLRRCENYIGLWHGEPNYWSYLDEITHKLEISRPRKGPLIDSPWLNSGRALKHPKDKNRVPNRPKVHMGTIASANALLKSPELRDELKENYGAMAVEMESSGIADATYQAEVGFLVIRGICDYANPSKNDFWQEYAAAAAAAFTKGLIESMVVTDI
jgi:nucleoside phosphorylase